MAQEIYIDCGRGIHTDRVYLTADSLDIFSQAAHLPSVKGKAGNELVAAFLEAIPAGILMVARRNIHDEYNDGMNGEAAVQKFDRNGKLLCIERYKNGLLHDGIHGEPAVEKFDSNGARLFSEHRKNGFLYDGDKNDPCFLPDADSYDHEAFVKTLNLQDLTKYIVSRVQNMKPHTPFASNVLKYSSRRKRA